MNKQEHIVKIYNAAGEQVNFERFAYKRADTVKKNFQKLLSNSLYAGLLKLDKASRAVCYATPDGYHETTVVWEMSL